MADHNVTEGLQTYVPGVTEEGFSFGALLDKFFQTSPLGKDLTAVYQGLSDTSAQELFTRQQAARATQKRTS